MLLAAPLVEPASAAETMTLTVSATLITSGRTIDLSGQLSGDPSCIGARTVNIAWRAADSSVWTIVDTTTSAADGSFAIANGQDYTGRFRAHAPATGSCTDVTSDAVLVRVRAYVDSTLVAGALVAGSCVRVDVRISPTKAGDEVRLQRRGSDGTWSTIETLTLDDTSSATTRPCFGWTDIGIVRLRAMWPAQDTSNEAGTGIVMAFRIGRAPWMLKIENAIGSRSVSVAVGDDGSVLYERAATAPRTPASNEKLLLSMALLDRFGPDHRIPTIAAAGGIHDGVVGKSLWILGRGDPEIGPSRMHALAARLVAAGVTAVRGRVMGSTGYFRHDWFARGWRSTTRRYVALPTALTFRHNVVRGHEIRDPELRAAASLTEQLRRMGVKVRGKPGAGIPPSGVAPLATISSRPLLALVESMDRPSDNFLAEVLGKGLGARRSGPPGTIPKGADALQGFVRSHGVGVSSFDSSGLSYADRVTADGIMRMLWFADTASWGRPLRGALAGGGQGTLRHRLLHVRVRAKTGTLDGISALSGWVWLRREARWGEFSILSSGMSKDTAVRIEDRIVRLISKGARA